MLAQLQVVQDQPVAVVGNAQTVYGLAIGGGGKVVADPDSSNHVLVPCEFRHTGPGVSEAELLECLYRVGDDKHQGKGFHPRAPGRH